MINSSEIARLQQLNCELLDTLELCLYAAKAFCEKNGIPFYDEKILSLIKKAELLIDEIQPLPFMHVSVPADEFLQRKPTDEDLTEPWKKR